MRIGLTYDLRSAYLKEGYTPEETAEFDRESTIEGIESVLQELGYETDRIGNVKNLVNRLSSGDRWDLVFNICEGMVGIGREAQVPCLLDAYYIPYTFSDPLILSLTLHKGMTKQIIRDAGINTADFHIVTTLEDLNRNQLPYPQFVKPVAEGTGKGISGASRIEDQSMLIRRCREMLPKYPDGLITETFLPGREFTAGVIGTGPSARVIGVVEILFRNPQTGMIYSYETKANYETLVEYQIPPEDIWETCAGMALQVWKTLACRDGGRVDIRYDQFGKPSFIEVNPLAGLDPIHSDLPILAKKHGISYRDLIRMILQSAIDRIPKPQ